MYEKKKNFAIEGLREYTVDMNEAAEINIFIKYVPEQQSDKPKLSHQRFIEGR